MIELLVQYRPALLHGLLVTLQLTSIVWSVGLLIGVAIGSVVARQRGARLALKAGVGIVTAIPILVLLMWFHYPAQTMLGIVVKPFITAAFVLTLVNVLLVADAVAAAAEAIPDDWRLMARASGLSAAETTWWIVLPLSARQLLGPLIFIQVGMLQATLFASLISVDELFRVIQDINSKEYQPVQLYSLLALFFLAICLPLQVLAGIANRRFRRDLASQ